MNVFFLSFFLLLDWCFLPRRAKFHLFFCWSVLKLYFNATVINKDATCNQFGMSVLLFFSLLLSFSQSFTIFIIVFVDFKQKHLLFQAICSTYFFFICPFFVRPLTEFRNFTWKRESNEWFANNNVTQAIFTQVFVKCVLNFILPLMGHLLSSLGFLFLFFFSPMWFRTKKSTWKEKKNNIDAFDVKWDQFSWLQLLYS